MHWGHWGADLRRRRPRTTGLPCSRGELLLRRKGPGQERGPQTGRLKPCAFSHGCQQFQRPGGDIPRLTVEGERPQLAFRSAGVPGVARRRSLLRLRLACEELFTLHIGPKPNTVFELAAES